MLFLLLTACTPEEPPTFTVNRTVEFSVTDGGGSDDWGGTALAWAVDTDAQATFVAGMAYELGVPAIDFEPDPDAAASAQAWELDVPEGMEDAIARWPMLERVITDTAGIQLMPMDFASVVALGDPTADTPDSVWIAFDGAARLSRTDNPGDVFIADLTYVEVTGFGSGASVVDETWGLAVEDVELDY